MNYLKQRFSKENAEKYSAGLFVSMAMSFMLAFYAPLVLFVSNLDDFLFDTTVILPILFMTFVVMFLIGAVVLLILYLINDKLYLCGLVGYFVAFVATYIQGNYFAGKLPVLDGSEIKWANYRIENVKTVIVWVILILVSALIIKFMSANHYYSLVKFVSVFIAIMLAFTAVYSFVSNEADRKETNETYVSQDTLLEMSEDTNFIIFLLDCTDSRTMKKLIDNNDEYADIFQDFTYYTNTMGTYPYTSRSVPFILSGEWYEFDGAWDDYLIKAYDESPLFEELENRGYSIDLYEKEVPNIENANRYNNVYSIKGKKLNSYKLAMLELKTTNFTYLPYYFKKYAQYTDDDFKKLRQLDNSFLMFSDNDQSFYQYINKNDVVYKEQKAFKYIHLEGAHSPFKYNKKLEKIPNATYESGMEGSLTLTKAYLDKLKSSGVYDNSVIIIMSDHGFEGYGEGQGSDRQNPIFFVKGVGEHHTLTYNDAPISYVDLQDAYVKLLDGAKSDSIFEYKEGDERERRFLMYGSHHIDKMYEYLTEGHASDTDAMYATGVEYINDHTNVFFKAIAKPAIIVINAIVGLIKNMGVGMFIYGLLVGGIFLIFYGLMLKKYYSSGVAPKLMIIILIVAELLLLAMSNIAINEILFNKPKFNTFFVMFDLRIIPGVLKGKGEYTVIITLVESIVVAFTMNKLHPLCLEQGKVMKITSYVVYVILGYYISWFLTIGTNVYYMGFNVARVVGLLVLTAVIKNKIAKEEVKEVEDGDKA